MYETQPCVNPLASRDSSLQNPTLKENIEAKINYHKQEIERLQKIGEQIPETMLAINLRDLREAMSY